jgi:predicted glycosyltransferase involved in capsule biosynthesis
LIKEKKTRQILNNTNLNLAFGFFSDGILKRKNTLRILWLAKLLAKSNKRLKGIRTCNMSFWKKDLLKVNGFNEDFVGWGREDTEIVVRLFNAGIMRNNLKFSALAYHLHHPENSRKTLPENDVLLQRSIKQKYTFCIRGLEEKFD